MTKRILLMYFERHWYWQPPTSAPVVLFFTADCNKAVGSEYLRFFVVVLWHLFWTVLIVPCLVHCLFSSPEPGAPGKFIGCYPPPSVVRSSSTFSKHLSSVTIGPILIKFHMKPPTKGGRKCLCLIQVTCPKWPPCPYMVNSLKIFSRTPCFLFIVF